MTRRRLVVAGDALLDRDIEGTVERLAPDAPVPVVDREEERLRPGGAALAAALVAADGHDVTLVTAIGDDDAGAELRALLDGCGVEIVDLGLATATPEKVRVMAGGRSLLRLDSGVRRPDAVGGANGPATSALVTADAVLVSDYGRGVAAEPRLRRALARGAGERPLVWDPHPAGPEPVPGAALTTPNAAEAERFAPEVGGTAAAATSARGRRLLDRWRCHATCITLGWRGALVVGWNGHPLLVPAPASATGGGDPCGAGDRFAATATAGLAGGAPAAEAVEHAVASASAFVEAGGAAGARFGAHTGPEGAPGSDDRPATDGVTPLARGAVDLAARERAAGRRVIATGGCFDLLHADHVRMLHAARALGDRLVVCLNSDASVARLKGAGRPIVPQEERAAVLEALGSVDAVLVFDEPTPAAAIERLRPAVWVKGGDYAAADLPEADAVGAYGGEIVILPELEGHSTTRLIEEATRRDAA